MSGPKTDSSRPPSTTSTDRGDYDHNTTHRDDGSRISWNTDKDGDYVQGSGHTTGSNGKSSQWDEGKQDHRY